MNGRRATGGIWRFLGVVVVVSLVLGVIGTLVASDPSGAAPSKPLPNPPNRPEKGLIYDGLERAPTGPCQGQFVVKATNACTHGPDPAPENVSIAGQPAPAVAGAATNPPCDGDGTSGPRTQVVYARSSDRPDRFTQYLESIRLWAAEADTIFDASAAETRGSRRIRFVHDGACAIVVANVVLSPAGDVGFGATTSDLRAMGLNRTDRKYVVFVDANVYCGIGEIWGDDQPGSANRNNGGPSFSRVDAGCWGGWVMAHELMHNIGGVQLSAPHSSGGWHCHDGNEVMCYNDGGSYFANGGVMQYPCPSSHASRFDCNHDDYYSTSPAAGSYLATKWNAANSQYLIPGPPVGAGTGLRAQYFGQPTLVDLRHTTDNSTVNFDWGSGSPPYTGIVPADNFSVRWSGEVEARYSQTYTFHTTTDDGVRLWVNDQLIINKWVDQAATEWSGSIALTAGKRYPIRMEYYERTGAAAAQLSWSSPSTPKQIVPSTQLYPAAFGSGNGLRAKYYGQPTLVDLRYTQNINVNLNWPNGSAYSGIVPDDNFSVRWTGEIQAQYSDVHTFHITSDDGVRLWVNDQLLVDRWFDQPPTEWSASISLTAGMRYPIRVEFYDRTGGAVAELRWSRPSTEKRIVPMEQLYAADMGTGSGLKGQYYGQPHLVDLRYTTVNNTVNFDWGLGSPYSHITPVDNFSVRWTGEVQPQFSDVYTFHVTSDDGVRLWVNNQLLVDRWVDQGATEWSGSIPLTAGTRNSIRMEYYERTGFAVAQLRWSRPSMEKRIVPMTQLYPAP